MTAYDDIAAHIARSTGSPFTLERCGDVGGGCISEAVLLEGGQQRYFVKLNRGALLPMFEAEAEALRVMHRTSTLRVPRPICSGAHGARAYLVLEYIEMGRRAPHTMAALGSGLAAMHRTTAAQFGWHRDNTIGSTPQINTRSRDWVAFWRKHRLGYQLKLAANNRAPARMVAAGERLLAGLDAFFTDYAPVPGLLHGDLWSGNACADTSGAPVVFDPAVYFGDREADLAMTELFGGFDRSFYAAYAATWALDPGYRVRRDLYNLYHVLNHFNLFGGGYAAQARTLIDGLLAQSG